MVVVINEWGVALGGKAEEESKVETAPPPVVSPNAGEELACVLYTSGTTGEGIWKAAKSPRPPYDKMNQDEFMMACKLVHDFGRCSPQLDTVARQDKCIHPPRFQPHLSPCMYYFRSLCPPVGLGSQ